MLASQWAEELEGSGWRIVWLALSGRDPKETLARDLNLFPEAPWGTVLEALWERPSLLVLEDLEGQEDLSPLLKHLGGLVLLASRKALSSPAILPLMARGQLIHLKTQELAFSLAEAERLVGDPVRAQEIWERSRGWALPLHLASLTGEMPERQALLEGVRESLNRAEWEEMLLLATLSHLPQEAASPETRCLAEAGFAQAVEAGFKLHPLAAEVVLGSYAKEVKTVVEGRAGRLPPIPR